MAVKLPNFFSIFVKDDVLHIEIEFDSDQMSPRESAKNWTKFRKF